MPWDTNSSAGKGRRRERRPGGTDKRGTILEAQIPMSPFNAPPVIIKDTEEFQIQLL